MLFRRCRRPAQESLPKQTGLTLFTAGRRSATLVREFVPTIMRRLTLLVDPGATSFTKLMRLHLSALSIYASHITCPRLLHSNARALACTLLAQVAHRTRLPLQLSHTTDTVAPPDQPTDEASQTGRSVT
jgi:hypothetical protein